MTETEKPDPGSDIVDADFDEPAVEAPEAAPAPKRGGFATSIAWLALFLALVATAGTGYLFFEDWRAGSRDADSADAIASLRRSLEDLDEQTGDDLSGLDEKLAELAAARERDGDALDTLRDDVDEFDRAAETLASLTPRVANLERSLAALQGVSIEARNTYLVAEAEYYMQIANAQLQLAGNPALASLALEQADDRLSQLGDPALTDVRRALANERAALDVMEKPDIAGVTLTLASLAQVAESLPVFDADNADEADAAEENAEASGPRRAWNAVKGAFSGVFTYSPPSDVDRPLLTPGAEPLLRGNLALQLQAARLALLRGEQELFRQSLDDADAWLGRYFDTSEASVTGMRETLREIRDEYQRVTPPDISGSLRALRQYRALTDTDGAQ